ncbi:MAG: hypothetical protein HKN10_18005 [Myxococcales bacterium]|nr:hypothetical protein [Myxococcales bacterium]
MSKTYQVKGSSISSKFDFVRERSGPDAENQLRARFDDEDRLFPILDSAWYPFELYDRVNRAIAELLFGGDLKRLEEVGIFSAERVLRTVYKSFAQGKDYVAFLKRAAILHQRFYDAGKMEVVLGEDGHSAQVVHSGAPVYAEADLYIASGFYRGAGRELGLSDVRSKFRLTEDGAHFDLDWR